MGTKSSLWLVTLGCNLLHPRNATLKNATSWGYQHLTIGSSRLQIFPRIVVLLYFTFLVCFHFSYFHRYLRRDESIPLPGHSTPRHLVLLRWSEVPIEADGHLILLSLPTSRSRVTGPLILQQHYYYYYHHRQLRTLIADVGYSIARLSHAQASLPLRSGQTNLRLNCIRHTLSIDIFIRNTHTTSISSLLCLIGIAIELSLVLSRT